MRRVVAASAGVLPLLALLLARRPAGAPPLAEPALFDPDVSWIAVSGGAEPSSHQVSLAQDLGVARRAFGPHGYTFFGGGPGAPIQLQAEPERSLRAALGEFFDPRDRGVRYVEGPQWVDAPAELELVLEALELAVEQGEGPLLLYLAGHGEGGDLPADSVHRLWGGWALGVPELADVLGAGSRPVRVVDTACFGGGFADLVFDRADASLGPSTALRCGVFATSFDQEASGCDPNPDRRSQESYAIHMLRALAGEEGTELDGEPGRSLLDAHTHARIRAESFDVPTTTSVRWLRHHAHVMEAPRADAPKVALPEEQAVVEALGDALDAPNERVAQRRLLALEQALGNEEAALSENERDVDDAYYALRIRLLERWPVLDDPFHPDFERTLRRHREAIFEVLQRSPVGRAHAAAQRTLEVAMQRYDRLRIRLARIRRLVDAHETIAFARALGHAGGEAWDQYQAIRRCEATALEALLE